MGGVDGNQEEMGIDEIEELKPPPYPEHDPSKCGGPGICLPCSIKGRAEMEEITEFPLGRRTFMSNLPDGGAGLFTYAPDKAWYRNLEPKDQAMIRSLSRLKIEPVEEPLET